MQPCRLAIGVTALAALLTTACSDECITPGHPAVRLSVRDAATGVPVQIDQAALTYLTDGGERPARLVGEPGSDLAAGEATVCCVPRPVRFRLAPAGYAAWDSTVSYSTRGRCDVPVPARVAVRLRRIASSSGAP